MKILVTGFLSLFFFTTFCQTRQVLPLDSLLKVLQTEQEDSNKVNTLTHIAEYYHTVSPLKAFPYIHEALALSEKLKWKKGIAAQYNSLGMYTADTGNHPLAREHYQASYQLNVELGDKKEQARNLTNIARSYQREANYTKATDFLFKALALAEELKDNDQLGIIGTNLAGCFITQKNYSKAAEYAEMTERYVAQTNNISHIIQARVQLGLIKAVLKDTVAAKMYMEKALKQAKENNDPVDEANVLVNLATLYFPNYKKQAEMMERVKEILDAINPTSVISLINSANLGDTYINMAGQAPASAKAALMEKAEASLLHAKTLAGQTNATEYLADIYSMMVHLEEEKGNYKAALDYNKKYTAINDSLFSQEKKNEIAGLEGKHNIAVKDKEIAVNKLVLADQRKTQLGLTAGLALLFIIGGLLFWQSRSRKKTNTTLMVLNNQLDEANKIKARFFGILSHDLRSPIVNLVHFLHLQKDAPGLLSEEQQASHRQSISDSAESLLNMMEAMLLWSKEQMENFKPHVKSVAVEDLFEYVQKFVGQTDKVTISFKYEPNLTVMADENYLRTIMQNLTSNAVRALNNTRNAHIEWSAKKENGQSILSITDNGPGIAASQAKALFEDDVVSNEKNGFGLHIIRDLAKAIRYKITVQSEQGRGTTFTLSGFSV